MPRSEPGLFLTQKLPPQRSDPGCALFSRCSRRRRGCRASTQARPKLAQFSGDVRAAALRGDELSGVRPYTVRTPDGSQENVYVLALEGDELSKARRRWGFQGDARGNPPHFD